MEQSEFWKIPAMCKKQIWIPNINIVKYGYTYYDYFKAIIMNYYNKTKYII